MAADSQLHAFELDGFWMDVGQPKDFLTGTCLYLSNLANKQPNLLAKSDSGYIYGDVLIDPTAKIGKDCRIGPYVTIGPNVVIGDGVRLQRCVILEGARVKDFAWVKNSIVGWHSTLGRWVLYYLFISRFQ
jgi:mannose-1-phosphate guanylyltransferase